MVGYLVVDDFNKWMARAQARAGVPFTVEQAEAMEDLYDDGYCVVDALALLPSMV